MLKIAIDGNEANVTNRVGCNVYAFELLQALEEITIGQSYTQDEPELAADITVLLAAEPHNEWPKAREGWQYQVIKPSQFWTQWAEPLYLASHAKHYDVFYTPGHYAPRLCPVPYLSSVMDLAFLEFPNQFQARDLFQLQKWTSYSIKNATKVAAISQFTKSEIIKHYHKNETEIIVIPPGSSEFEPEAISQKVARQLLRQAGIGRHFFLYVGTIQPRKNLIKLIAAFDLLCDELGEAATDLQLVIAGKVGWLADETLARVAASPHQSQIILPGFVSDEFKQVLLERCLANFNLGLYEGFGIPALEALQLGAIPVVANNTSLPEVIGPAGIKVDPTDLKQIKAAMQRLLQVTMFERDVFLAQAKKQIQKYSYDQSARLVLHTLQEIASTKKSCLKPA